MTGSPTVETPETPKTPTTILVVDDEPQVLRAIKRCLRRGGYNILLAEGGEEALQLLDEHDIALIICDQRMPGMSGAEVLTQVWKRSPDVYRITLTGYTDLESAQRSINEGHVNKFLTKPWDDKLILEVVAEGVERFELARENKRLQELTKSQNQQLEAWNQQLDDQVQQRTEQLQERNKQLSRVHERLRRSLLDTVAVLAGVLEAYDPSLGIRAKRIARLTREVARKLELSDEQRLELEFAAFLHDVGMISRINNQSAAKRTTRTKPSEIGWALLSRVHGFGNVALAVRHQGEHYNGNGTPDGLKGDAIPIGSRIIAACVCYEDALRAAARPTEMTPLDAQRAVLAARGAELDPDVVDALLEIVEHIAEINGGGEVEVSPRQLRVGMELARDLCNVQEVLLLKAGTLINEDQIARIRQMADEHMLAGSVFVQAAPIQDVCTSHPSGSDSEQPSDNPSPQPAAGQGLSKAS